MQRPERSRPDGFDVQEFLREGPKSFAVRAAYRSAEQALVGSGSRWMPVTAADLRRGRAWTKAALDVLRGTNAPSSLVREMADCGFIARVRVGDRVVRRPVVCGRDRLCLLAAVREAAKRGLRPLRVLRQRPDLAAVRVTVETSETREDAERVANALR